MTSLVIATGNRLRGDDAAGPAVAERLAERNPPAEILICHQLTPELAERLAGVDFALFIDASTALPAGECDLMALVPAADPVGLGHAASPAGLLALAARLYGRAPAAQLLRLGAADFTLGAPLSEPVAAMLERAVALADGALPGASFG